MVLHRLHEEVAAMAVAGEHDVVARRSAHCHHHVVVSVSPIAARPCTATVDGDEEDNESPPTRETHHRRATIDAIRAAHHDSDDKQNPDRQGCKPTLITAATRGKSLFSIAAPITSISLRSSPPGSDDPSRPSSCCRCRLRRPHCHRRRLRPLAVHQRSPDITVRLLLPVPASVYHRLCPLPAACAA
ncbi:hypothetical protein ACLOJK_036444 [Asimina triloba]